MFFILSKLLVIFIYPITWVFITLLLGLALKNQRVRRGLLTCAFALLLIFSNPFLLDLFANAWDIKTPPLEQRYTCAIVLGGFVSEDRKGSGYFNGAADRFLQAMALKHDNKVDYLLFSGGNADFKPGKFREAEWLADQMSLFNVPDSVVIIEKNSRNTLENVKFSKELLRARGLKPPYLLVTSAFHMRRSLLTFNALGLQVDPYSCNYIAGQEKTSFKSFIPRAEILSNWNVYMKEVIGYLAYSFKTKASKF
jgi:uncharacterized SAM-binding protein YcdF (DUF218 family)